MLVLLNIGRIFYSDFGLFYQVPMDSGLLYSVTTTIDTYVYRGLVVSNDVARASAAGFFQSIMGFIMILLANTIVRKYQQENALF
jgi:putative aldouronate transport system permease protein